MPLWKNAAAALFLLTVSSEAFTVAPPPPLEIAVASPLEQPMTTTTLSHLPSPKFLLSASSTPLPTTLLAAAAPAPATTGVSVTQIEYDGRVPKTEADEYVVVTNSSKSPMDISGYYLYVATTGTQGPTFYFPKGSVLKPGASVRIYTNEIHKETGGYSFGSGKAIWSNKGGLAVLRDGAGKKVCEFKYKPS